MLGGDYSALPEPHPRGTRCLFKFVPDEFVELVSSHQVT